MTTNEMMMRYGFCRVPRGMESRLRTGCKARAMGVFVWLLTHAVRSDCEWNGVALRRGQVFVSTQDLADTLGMTYGVARRTLDDLCEAGLVTKQTAVSVASRAANGAAGRATNRGTLVTVCDYGVYNGYMGEGDKPGDTRRDEPGDRHNREYINKENPNKESHNGEEGEEGERTAATAGEEEVLDEESLLSVEALPGRLLRHASWAENYERNHGLTETEMAELLRLFVVHLQSRGTERKTLADAMRHFASWHRCRTDNERRAQQERLDRQEEARQRERQRADERAQEAEAERQRKAREEHERKIRILTNMKSKALAGDQLAREMMDKYNVWEECEKEGV